MKYLKEQWTLLEDMKSAIFFKDTDTISELVGPPLIQDSTLISPNELEVKVFKIKKKWTKKMTIC